MTVNEQIQQIKLNMPNTYRAIQAEAAKIGNDAYALVRRALKGEANCFYAMEHGFVVGTPFNITDITAETAKYMVQFGCAYVCIFPDARGGTNGAH